MTENKGAVKVTFRCDAKHKPKLKEARAVMHISVGQLYQEGEKFEATINLINKTFSSCDIMLCDTLQRHSMGFVSNLEEKALHEASLKAGDEWLEDNKNILKRLTIPHKIIRWDYWLNHSDYPKQRMIIDDLYQNNSDYREKVQETINVFLNRFKKRVDGNDFDEENFFYGSLEYLKEECAIIVPIWVKLGYEFVIYPRKRTAAMEMIDRLLVKPFFPELMRPVWFKFTRRSLNSPIV